MAKVIFNGDPDSDVIEQGVTCFGIDFITGEPIEVEGDVLIKLAGNDHFTVEGLPTPEELADTNNSGKVSNKEVRAAAQKAGIEDWETARISKLKKALNFDVD